MPTANGVFKKWMDNCEYGLIKPYDMGEDVVVHKSLLQHEMEYMCSDEPVAYEAVWNGEMRMWVCTNIVVVRPPPPPGPPQGSIPRPTEGEPVRKYPRQ